MTLPTNINLPLPSDYIDDPEQFFEDLINKIDYMYENIAEHVNGSFRNNMEIDGSEWIPTLQGDSSGTFTYTEQVGWVLRKGIMTDVWGSVSWSATTASGNLFIELPYLVTQSVGSPFVGTCITSNITYASGTNSNISAQPDTYNGYIITSGSGVGKANLNVPASGTLEFHIRYIGVSDE